MSILRILIKELKNKVFYNENHIRSKKNHGQSNFVCPDENFTPFSFLINV